MRIICLVQPWERDRAVRRGEADDRARPACADQVAAHLLAHEEGMVPPTRSTEIGAQDRPVADKAAIRTIP
jgi:hypothetical protein